MFALEPQTIVSSYEVLKWILKAKDLHMIEGVTFLGGEPMLQAKGLAEVAKSVKEAGLSVMVFTGYLIEELQDLGFVGVHELLANTDILVDGPFIESCLERVRNWAGSENQRFHFLTDRYSSGNEYDPRFPYGFEIRIGLDGKIGLNGWPVDFRPDTIVSTQMPDSHTHNDDNDHCEEV